MSFISRLKKLLFGRETVRAPQSLRAVIDTNILIGAMISDKAASYRIIRHFYDGNFEMILSPSTRREAENLFSKHTVVRTRPSCQEAVRRFWQEVEEKAVIVPDSTIKRVTMHQADDKFVAAALTGQAQYVVSNDRHLLKVRRYKGIRMIEANAFVAIIEQDRLDSGRIK